MEKQSVRSIMQNIREGNTFRSGFNVIAHYDWETDTFLLDSLHNGTQKRDLISAKEARGIIKESIQITQ